MIALERAAYPDPARIQEQRGQPKDRVIEGGQIRRPMSGTIADKQLMFEQQRFRGESAGATRVQQLREGGKQVDDEDQKFAHERTLPPPPSSARLPGTGGFRHPTNSPPTALLAISIRLRSTRI
jgi:hypothetical protein